jgi:hypothetical protein
LRLPSASHNLSLATVRLRGKTTGVKRRLTRQVSWSMFNQSVCALRFLYNVTLGQPHVITHLPFAKRPRVLPTVLSPEEVQQLLDAAVPLRDRTLLDVTYSCGCNPQGVLDVLPHWVSCRPGLFLPVRVLSRVFRGKYLELLRAAFDQGQKTMPRIANRRR